MRQPSLKLVPQWVFCFVAVTMFQGSIGFCVGMREALEAAGRRPQSTDTTTFWPGARAHRRCRRSGGIYALMAQSVQVRLTSQQGCRVPADPAIWGKLGKPAKIAKGWSTGNLDEGIGWKFCLQASAG
jgi:hypothetical protein